MGADQQPFDPSTLQAYHTDDRTLDPSALAGWWDMAGFRLGSLSTKQCQKMLPCECLEQRNEYRIESKYDRNDQHHSR